MKNNYELQLDEMLEGKVFEGKGGLDCIPSEISRDVDLEKLNKIELIQIIKDMKEKATTLYRSNLYEDIIKTKKDLIQIHEIDLLSKEIMRSLLEIIHGFIAEIPKIKQRALVKNSSKGGYTRAQNSIKYQEKKFVFECWKEWQSKPHLYKNKTQFAKDMIRKFDHDDCEEGKHIQSEPKICAWCREWEKMSPSQLGAYSAS